MIISPSLPGMSVSPLEKSSLTFASGAASGAAAGAAAARQRRPNTIALVVIVRLSVMADSADSPVRPGTRPVCDTPWREISETTVKGRGEKGGYGGLPRAQTVQGE